MSCSNQRKKGMDSQWVALFSDDHSRVVLQQIPGRPKSSDYINANFIDVSLFSQMQSSPSFIAQQVFAAKVDWIKLYTFQSMLNYLNTCSNLFKHLKFSIFFILWNIFFLKRIIKYVCCFFWFPGLPETQCLHCHTRASTSHVYRLLAYGLGTEFHSDHNDY